LTAAAGAMDILIKAGEEGQDEQARFNALVDKSPLATYKSTMQDLANTWSMSTRFQRDNILAAEGQLSIYTNIGQKTFPDALKASLNLATYMKTDATQGAVTLGRALEDINGGSLMMLQRQRLLTHEQVEQAKSMAQAGGSAGMYRYEMEQLTAADQKQVQELEKKNKTADALKLMWSKLSDGQRTHALEIQKSNGAANAQQYVMDILNGKIGDLATTMGGTFAGKAEIFNNKWREFTEDEGQKVLQTLEPLMSDLNDLADNVLPAVGRGFDTIMLPVLRDFSNIVTNVFSGNMTASQGVGKMLGGMFGGFENITGDLLKTVKGIDWKKVSDDIAADIKSIDWSKLGGEFGNGLRNLMYAGWQILSTTDWKALLGTSLTGFADFVVSMFQPGANWKTNVQDVWQGDFDAIALAWKTHFTDVWAGDFKTMGSIWTNYWLGVKKEWIAFIDEIKAEWDKLWSAISAHGGVPSNRIGYGGAGAGHAAGADFIVPPGYPNDSFPMRVQSGERVIVIPNGETSQLGPAALGAGQSGKVLQNHGTIILQYTGDQLTVSKFMSDLGAAMG
jgi:hypothetical protein